MLDQMIEDWIRADSHARQGVLRSWLEKFGQLAADRRAVKAATEGSSLVAESLKQPRAQKGLIVHLTPRRQGFEQLTPKTAKRTGKSKIWPDAVDAKSLADILHVSVKDARDVQQTLRSKGLEVALLTTASTYIRDRRAALKSHQN